MIELSFRISSVLYLQIWIELVSIDIFVKNLLYSFWWNMTRSIDLILIKGVAIQIKTISKVRCIKKQNISYITTINFAQTTKGRWAFIYEWRYRIFRLLYVTSYLLGLQVTYWYTERSLCHNKCCPGAAYYLCWQCLIHLVA